MNDRKRVFITGASAGLGRDAVTALARRGHTVYATMRGVAGSNAEAASALASWAAEAGHAVHVIECDVTDDTSVGAAVTAAVERGGIDVVINNAGVGVFGIDEGYTIEQARRVFEVNVFGVMRVNRAVVPHLRAAGRGALVYVSSIGGRIVIPFMAIYVASKFALEAFAEGTSHELAPLGIESVIVEPGGYATNYFANVLRPGDVMSQYGAVAEWCAANRRGVDEMARSGALGDPAEVSQVLVEEVERPAGRRPLRRVVGEDFAAPTEAINEVCERVQASVLTALRPS